MSLNYPVTLVRSLAIIAILASLAACSYASEDILSLKWMHGADGDVRGIAVGDVDNDSVPEIVAATSDTVYVLSYDGILKNKYGIDFPVSALQVGDINGDGYAEILLGSGFLNTFDTNITRFDFSNAPTIIERPELIYKVMRDNGDVYVIKRGSNAPEKLLNMNEWVRDIYVDDLDRDGNSEILVATGGTNVDYIEKITQGTDPVTHNSTDIRNFSEVYVENGSASVYMPNGTLKAAYRMDQTVWRIHPVTFKENSFKDIVAGGERIVVLNSGAVPLADYKYLQNNYTVWGFSTSGIGGGVEELAVVFSTAAVGGVYVFNGLGNLLWEYRIPSGHIVDASFASIDINGKTCLLVASNDGLYILDNDGKLKWTQAIIGGVDHLEKSNTGKSAYDDYVMSSGNNVYLYTVDPKFVRLQLAESFFAAAKANYEDANYQAAVSNLSSAKSIYTELSNQEGLAASDELLSKINQNLKSIKKANADALYKTARVDYYAGRTAESRDNIGKAKEIYSQIRDLDGVAKCDSFFKDMEAPGSTAGTVATTQTVETTPEATTSTAYVPPKDEKMSPIVVGLFAVIAVFLIVFGMRQIFVNKKNHKKDQADHGDFEEDVMPEAEILKAMGQEQKAAGDNKTPDAGPGQGSQEAADKKTEH